MRKKFLICLAVFLSIAFMIIYSALCYRYGKNGAISRLQTAIKNKDAKTAAALIKSSDKGLIIDEKNIKSFLNYISSNKKDYNELLDNLRKQAETMDMKDTDKNENYWHYYLTLKKSDKKFLIFDTYCFEMKPCYVNFTMLNAFEKIYVDGKYICSSEKDGDKKICGPFVQGQHTMETVWETILGRADSLKTLNFTNPYFSDLVQNTFDCPAYTDGGAVSIACNYKDAEIFINDKDSGKTVSDFSQLGPIDNNTAAAVYVQKAFPWGTAKSDKYTIRKSTGIFINLRGANNKLLDKLKAYTESFNNKFAAACRSRNISPLGGYGAGFDPGFILGLSNNFDYMRSKNIYFKGNYLYSSIIPDSVVTDYDNTSLDTIYRIIFDSMDYYDTDFSMYYEPCQMKTSKNGIRNSYTLLYDTNKNTWTICYVSPFM